MSKPLTATDEIIQYFAEKIISNALKPNEKLPNERDLAEHFGVTRARVREALRGLATAGLIEIRYADGSYVRSPKDRLSSDVVSWLLHPRHTTFQELFEVREIFEKAMYLKAFDNCNKLDLVELGNKIEVLNNIELKDIKSYADALDDLDCFFASITRNPLLISLMQVLVHLRRDTVERVLKVGDSPIRSRKMRTDIFNAFKSDDKEKVIFAVENFYSDSIQGLSKEL